MVPSGVLPGKTIRACALNEALEHAPNEEADLVSRSFSEIVFKVIDCEAAFLVRQLVFKVFIVGGLAFIGHLNRFGISWRVNLEDDVLCFCGTAGHVSAVLLQEWLASPLFPVLCVNIRR